MRTERDEIGAKDNVQKMEADVDCNLFREAMSRLGAAVSVVTSDGVAGACGTTVTAVTSVTDTPATLLVCLNQQRRAHDIIRDNRVLCVNVLSDDQVKLAEHFAGQTGIAMEHRFDGIRYDSLQTGAPLLEGALVSFDCRVSEVLESGTHSIFLAQIQGIRLGDRGSALVYFQRRYATLNQIGD